MERAGTYDEQELDLKLILLKVWKHKGWVLLSLLVSLAAGYLYWQRAPRVYEANMTVLFKDQNTLGYGVSEQMLLEDMGFFGRNRIMQNEIEVIQSPSLMQETVEKLDLHYQIYRDEEFSSRELYTDAPIIIDSTSLRGNYRLRKRDAWILEEMTTEASWEVQEGQVNLVHGGLFAFRQKEGGEPSEAIDLYLNLLPSISAARQILSQLEVERPGEWATILQLRLEASLPEKAKDILTTLIDSYAEMMREEKNEGFERSLQFIKERIADLSGELASVELQIENYKEENRIAGEANELIGQLSGNIATYDQERSSLLVQREVLNDLKNTLATETADQDLLPSTFLQDRQGLSTNIEAYNSLLMEARSLRASASTDNPRRREVEESLRQIRANILLNVGRALKENQVALDQLEQEIRKLERSFAQIPQKQRELLNIVREQKVKESLYLYLLEKREEIALNMNLAPTDVRVVDPANATLSPIRPIMGQILGIAAAIGLFLPIGIILLIDLLDTKLRTREDIKRKTDTPILGEIMEAKGTKYEVVAAGKDIVSESFRLLRTNTQFMLSGKEHARILITSGESGEGKTFISSNLAVSYALTGRNVLLMGLDLRKPKLHHYFNKAVDAPGLTHYILNQATEQDIIQSTPYEQLDLVLSGLIPPNPAELLLSDRFKELMDSLSTQYEIIIWDAAPVGLVSDTLNIKEQADATLFVVRQGVSDERTLEGLQEGPEGYQLKHVGLVMNAVKTKSLYGYGKYRYGYGAKTRGYLS